MNSGGIVFVEGLTSPDQSNPGADSNSASWDDVQHHRADQPTLEVHAEAEGSSQDATSAVSLTTLPVAAAAAATVTDPGVTIGSVPDPAAALAVPGSPHWRAQFQRLVVVIDLAAALVGVLVGLAGRFGFGAEFMTPQRLVVTCLLPLAWLCCAGFNRAYEVRFLGAGAIEFQRVGRAFLHLVALTAFGAFATKTDLSRGFLLLALPMTFLLSIAGRYAARKVLHSRRKRGGATVPVLVVGNAIDIVKFSDTLRLNDHAGLQVAAACVTQREPVAEADLEALTASGIVTVGDVDTIRDAVAQSGARSVAVISRDITGEKLRWISWQLEGTATDLVLLPGLAEVAGRRLNIQQLGGLPLLYVAEPEFRGMRRVVKAGCDRLAALIALLLLTPFMLVIAALVRATSRGPAMFFQTRVGKDGKTFRMVKFRSMCNGAQHQIVQLQAANDVVGGTLFKMRSDPRVTKVGRVLRRFSLDELPQLFNVLAGSMSLVGPRPPLPAEVGTYGRDAHRRLLVKPGLTGLWQISGRSDLSWEESVRLDLRYVESWSLTLDLVVLLKTVRAVFRGTGAY